MRDSSAFLHAHGFGAAQHSPLPADASHRFYTRLIGGPTPALLMDAPPPENVRPFLRIARHLSGVGLSAPEIIAADEAAGFLLIEDFGDATHATLLDAGADPAALYAEAAETLATLKATVEKNFPALHAPGLSAAASVSNKIVWSEGVGLADLKNHHPTSEFGFKHQSLCQHPFPHATLFFTSEFGLISSTIRRAKSRWRC